MKDLKIPFRGLKIGIHDYEWEINKKFFEVFENPDVLDCHVNVKLQMEKQERMFTLFFNIEGTLLTTCDRCMGDLSWPVQINEQYIIKLGHEREEESENVLIIPETDYEIDIGNLIFDYLTLALPMKKVHQENEDGSSGCDPKTLKILKDLSHKEGTDPRWDALKDLKLDNNN